ncbi:hypothetical protein Q4610_16875 [Sphingobium sp. HBC34]|uniref:DUF4286 domain-containing protein n=1 Tax=Sphingobium cyanobacteriorum TaxID=3063954 RepID=A0ABT8ZRK3_9SPHN|nr:DUF4286 family protein [Sphingobium sp. HBC34]MDO7836723.1 hypothetical protein [Sphingobium sp. HBC34]
MARYKMVAFSNAVEGRDEDFNQWYDQQHIKDVLAIPGVVSAERFTCVGEGAQKYMAIYEVETDDLSAVMAELGKRPGTDVMPISDAVDFSSGSVGFWQPYAK